jgi:D-alanine-D-alanine ligase
MSKCRVLALVHESFVPPDSIEGLTDKQIAPFKTEFDVVSTLREMGHETQVLGVANDLGVVGGALSDFKPDIVFNLLEEFGGQGVFVPYLLGYLELIRQPYTGCNPAGMMLTYSKPLSKKLLKFHRIKVPDFHVFPREKRTRRPAHLQFPLIVKSTTEHGSVGITQASIVRDDAKLAEQVARVHDELQTDAIAEQYIEGREFYAGIIGNHRLSMLPVWELHFDNPAEGAALIATQKVKWDYAYQQRRGVRTEAATGLENGLLDRIQKTCKRTYRILGQTGYARIDLRLAADGQLYVLESNPNPQLAHGEDFAASAQAAGTSYAQLLQRILNLGLAATGVWQG